MANIKSAKKRIITSQKRAAANKAVKSGSCSSSFRECKVRDRQSSFQGRTSQEYGCP